MAPFPGTPTIAALTLRAPLTVYAVGAVPSTAVVVGGPGQQGRKPVQRRHRADAVQRRSRSQSAERPGDDHRIGSDQDLKLQEDLDGKQLAVIGDEDRRIEES